jgi:hypothetical protein
MHMFIIATLAIAIAALAAFVTIPSTAAAHEGHKIECNQAALNALQADIQAMGDGDAKAAASKELGMAEEMLAENNLKTCLNHMHNTMEAIEK